MQKKRWLRMAVMGLLVASLLTSGSGVLAKTVVKTDVFNNFQMGVVDVELNEYQTDGNGKETAFINNIDVLPGKSVSKIPRITNEAVDSYVRIKVEVETDIETERPITTDDIFGWNEHLVKKGEYFYYKNILKHGESFDLFKGIKIPHEWDEEAVEKSLQLKIDVDAIQSRNFVPDFTKELPWGSVEMEKCLHEDGYDFNKFKKGDDKELSVTLIDKAAGLVHKPDDFFINFSYMLPGDELRDSVTLKNSYTKPMALYFASNTVESGGTLDKLDLKITLKLPDGTSRNVYSGNLNTDMEYRLLGTFYAGQEGELNFTVTVPAELTNKYALDTGKVQWLFMAEFEEDVPKEDPKEDPKKDKPKDPTPPAKPQRPTPKPTLPVPPTHIFKTGDASVLPYAVVFVLSVAGLILLKKTARKEQR